MLETSSFINGKFTNSSDKKLDIKNKYTLETIARVGLASAHEIEEAITSSVSAFHTYSKFTSGKRYDLLSKFLDLFIAKREELITLLISEAGKPRDYAAGEFDRCVETIRFALEETRRIGGEVVPMDFSNGSGKMAMTSRFAIGPVLGISPFNFPLNLTLHKLAPALASGCSIIIKPSPYTPQCNLLLGKLVQEAGFPDGLVNIVICENKESELLVRDERIKLLSFTGSPKIGWMLKSIAGKKKVILELGGNAAVIVDETSDIDRAAKEIAIGSFLYAGQICISTQRIFVAGKVYKEFKEKLISEASKLECGDPSKSGVMVGPIIDKVHVERIGQWIEEAKQGGAKLLLDGRSADVDHNILLPTLIENYKSEDKVCFEEVFGPVAILKEFKTEREAIDLVNDSRFGLQVGVYSNKLDFIKQCFKEIEVGALIVNSIPGFRIDNMPYGGVKDSGLGREGIKYAIDDMTDERLLII